MKFKIGWTQNKKVIFKLQTQKLTLRNDIVQNFEPAKTQPIYGNRCWQWLGEWTKISSTVRPKNKQKTCMMLTKKKLETAFQGHNGFLSSWPTSGLIFWMRCVVRSHNIQKNTTHYTTHDEIESGVHLVPSIACNPAFETECSRWLWAAICAVGNGMFHSSLWCSNDG